MEINNFLQKHALIIAHLNVDWYVDGYYLRNSQHWSISFPSCYIVLLLLRHQVMLLLITWDVVVCKCVVILG